MAKTAAVAVALVASTVIGIVAGAYHGEELQRILFAPSLSAMTPPAQNGDGQVKGAGEKDDHGAGEEHEEERSHVELTPEQVKLAGIVAVPAALGELDVELSLTGEVTLNRERTAQVSPRVPGVLVEVRAQLGERLRAGQVMAIIESRELADAKAAHLAARERLELAQSRFEREERLWKQKITAEQDYVEARQALAEARIETRSADVKLRALGLSHEEMKELATQADRPFAQVSINAPFDGTVIERDAAPGELVTEETALFRIADLQTVWVIANVFEKDMPRLKLRQPASVTVRALPGRSFSGRVTWIADTIDEQTRTLPIRIEVENKDRALKPGYFVKAAVVVDEKQDAIVVPTAAVQRSKGESVVFVEAGVGRFQRREVALGVVTNGKAEVVFGLDANEPVVTDGSFILKSELEKAGFEAGHGH